MRIGAMHPCGVRYRPDTGFEMRCDDCVRTGDERFWPIDLEFWDPRHGMTRCRACWRRKLAATAKANRAKDPEKYRERVRRRRRDPEELRIQKLKDQARWQEIKADPVKLAEVRAKNRVSNARYRARKRLEKAA